MGKSTNIYFAITDKGTPTLASISDKTKALDKETQDLTNRYAAMKKGNETLIKRQTELQAALKSAREETARAKKAFDELGDAATQDAYNKAKIKQQELASELSQTGKAIKENQVIYKQYMEELRKGALGSSYSGSKISMGIGLISGQVGQLLSSSIGGIAESYLTSALGVPTASLASGTLSSAITGAVAGSTFGIYGTLIGGLAGAISGLISGAGEINQEKDSAFIDYYNSLYEDVNEETEEMISSGSTTAGSREQTRKAFMKRLGSETMADRYLAQVEEMAASTNYSYDEITGYAKLLLNTYKPQEVFDVLQSLSDATAGLSLSSSDISTMISGLSRMRTTGKTTTEYLNYFSERGIDVYSALAEALGVDKSGIADMVSKGEIGGEYAAEAILDYINSQYGGLSEELMSTYDAMTDNLEDIMTTIEAAGGEGYNEMRKSGLSAETEAYSGALGEALKEANRIAGENKAYLDNLAEQYEIEALSAVLMGGETTLFTPDDQAKLSEMAAAYQEATAEYDAGNQEAGLRMESLTEQARALATAAYESSEQYMALNDTELDQIAAIRANTKGLEAATYAYTLGVEKSKGQSAYDDDGASIETFMTDDGAIDFRYMYSDGSWMDSDGNWHSNAVGLDRVPYDNFPALLHEGERVLTASEARAQDNAGGGGIRIIISGNSFTGSTEEMAGQLAEILARELERAAVTAVK